MLTNIENATPSAAANKDRAVVMNRPADVASTSSVVFEAPALGAGFDGNAMMDEAIEQHGCHLGVEERRGTKQSWRGLDA